MSMYSGVIIVITCNIVNVFLGQSSLRLILDPRKFKRMAVFFIPWIKQEVINKAETMDHVSASAELWIDWNNNLKLSLLNLIYQSVLMRTNIILDRAFSQFG